ncbi:glycosyltransferase [Lithospermum erythrorhizon]|uniref:Glycosyltransferase n=1 Tax=Lithospermum erythrorhizon TaxID=34254 RepID=A0AAV3Q7C5_LITER
MSHQTLQSHVEIINQKVVVVMVPLPAQGHLNQLLQLSHLLSSYNIPVHYVGTATHNRQVRLRSAPCNSPLSTTNIHFHEFQPPSYPTPPPNPHATHKFPSQLIPLFNSTKHLRTPISNMVQELSQKAKRVIVIYDSMMAWVVQDVLSIPKAERYCFNSVSVLTILTFHLDKSEGKNTHPLAEILKELPAREKCLPPEFYEFSNIQKELRKLNAGNLHNSNRLIEGPFLDLISKENIYSTTKQWAIGPFNPINIPQANEKNGVVRHKCLEWLDKQAPNSVIFVSFGTTTTLPDEQIKELALGLEDSGHSFIWVLRDADKGDVFVGGDRKAKLPQGFEERTKNRGIVTRDWAPQLQILGHVSTGGFMSHCGWNSCMESITMGVPIAAWPMHSDQPINAVLVTKILKIALLVAEWEPSTQEVVTSVTIEKAVKKVMGSVEGDEVRKNVMKLSKAVKESVMEGGVTRKEMDSFIDHITR